MCFKTYERKLRTRAILFKIISTIQQAFFPALEKELAAPLGEKGGLFVTVVELARPERFMECFEWQGMGCPRKWRLPLLLAFVAKAVWNFPTTRALLERLAHDPCLRRLCGWEKMAEIPSEATFSRAFAEFARGQLPQIIHEALVREKLGEKLVGHISRDSTAIEGREKPAKKPPKAPKPKAKRGRPRKGEERPKPVPTRLERQGGRTLAENLADLPTLCDVGAKKNAQGVNQYWVGYKLHVDTADGDIPVSAILSSARLYDSQAAIPLAQMTARGAVKVMAHLMLGGHRGDGQGARSAVGMSRSKEESREATEKEHPRQELWESHAPGRVKKAEKPTVMSRPGV